VVILLDLCGAEQGPVGCCEDDQVSSNSVSGGEFN
jgi:hypothetical protein